jgi:hypothetical protein
MARNFPEKYKSKLETLKRAIIIRSPLKSELGDNNISIEVVDWDYNQSNEQFYEIHLEVIITNVECEDCYFEGGIKIGEELNDLMEKLMKSAKLKVGSELQVGGGNSLRGIVIHEVDFSNGNFRKIVFGLVYDPNYKD